MALLGLALLVNTLLVKGTALEKEEDDDIMYSRPSSLEYTEFDISKSARVYA